jgi:hypothetical protein
MMGTILLTYVILLAAMGVAFALIGRSVTGKSEEETK